ncbi:uncharacterized protein EDB93DRAFT_1255912 [Suillus bovinus]|uniref:uncharacterized protein n=1 Tax=Suillus bovinus TaxID=48563 RepID=UPI001B8791FA|nr:uncharacterized protein EDB93DRAFT_1255912 [Suillus bovinus]KAG2130430.1 hypothetical protein EDB93DRAFT_1255912 [Suillus bovinus]
MDSSPPSSPVQSSSPPSSPAQMNSPTIQSSPDSSSPSGMTLLLNASHLSVSQQSKPAPSQADESLFFRSDKMSNSQLSRKYLSYPTNPAPLELHYAAQVMKSKFQLEFSLEETQKLQEQLESGLSQLSTPTLYKGYKAKLASREVARQRMVLATWEIDEATQYEAFLMSIYGENEQQFKMAEGELQGFKRIFSQCGQAELEDNKQYLQAVYEDKCEILHVSSTQTDQIAKLLSSRVKQAFLKPTAAFPLHPNSGLPCIGTREPSEPSDPEMSDESYLDELPEGSDHGSEDSSKGAGSEKSAG